MPELQQPDEAATIAITTLLLSAASLMEDASVEAISRLPADPGALKAHTARLHKASRDIAALTAAAHVLARGLMPATVVQGPWKPDTSK